MALHLAQPSQLTKGTQLRHVQISLFHGLCNDGSIQVNVLNNLPVGTTLHWHGINQLETPWSDGVPGISQRQVFRMYSPYIS